MPEAPGLSFKATRERLASAGLTLFLVPFIGTLLVATAFYVAFDTQQAQDQESHRLIAENLEHAASSARTSFEQSAMRVAENAAERMAGIITQRSLIESELPVDPDLLALVQSSVGNPDIRLSLIDPVLDKLLLDRQLPTGQSITSSLPEVAWLLNEKKVLSLLARSREQAMSTTSLVTFDYYEPPAAKPVAHEPEGKEENGGRRLVALLPVRGTRYMLAAVAPITGASFQVWSGMQRAQAALKAADARNRGRDTWLGVVVALLLGAITAGGFWASRRCHRKLDEELCTPASRVERLAREIEAGRFETRLAREGLADDWETLALAINRMLDRWTPLVQSEEQQKRLQSHIIRLLEQTSRAAKGDLTVRGSVNSDLLGNICDALNLLLDSMSVLVAQVQESGYHISQALGNLQDATRKVGIDSKRSSRELTQVNGLIAGATRHIQRAAQDGDQANREASRALEAAETASENIAGTIENMQRMRANVQASAKTIKTLGERSLEINAIVELIGDISGRTNILSLNAAIEASRAGEQGKGFAVVADEIRKLAERTVGATKDISSFIEEIQIESNDAVVAMEEIVRDVEQGWRQSEKTAQSLQQIGEIVRTVLQRVGEISAAQRLLVTQLDQVGEGIKSVYQISKDTTAAIYQGTTETRNVVMPLERLNKAVRSYKLPPKFDQTLRGPWTLPSGSDDRESLLALLTEPDFTAGSPENSDSPAAVLNMSPDEARDLTLPHGE